MIIMTKEEMVIKTKDIDMSTPWIWLGVEMGFSRPARPRLVYRSWEVAHSIGAGQGFLNPVSNCS
jgi:hypothetical protein